MSSDNSSDSEKEQRDEFSDSEKEELDTDEYRPNAVDDDLRAEYASFADFEQDIKRYSAATFQTFIKRRSEKLKAGHAWSADLQYKKLTYNCVHHSEYKSKGTGKREFAHSRKKACGAEIRVSAQLRRGVLEVQQRNEVHNHKLSEHVWKHLPENRRLDQEQESKVISMTESHAADAAACRDVLS